MPCQIIESNYKSKLIILPDMKAIRPITSEKLCSQRITILKMHEKVKVLSLLQNW